MKKISHVGFHFLAIVIEALGTLFVFLDAERLDARSPINGMTLGDPKGYTSWCYHSGRIGFLLLFGGIILQAVLIFARDYQVEKIESRLKRLEGIAKSEVPAQASETLLES